MVIVNKIRGGLAATGEAVKEEWSEVKAWLGPVPGAIADHVNVREFLRVVVLVLSTTGLLEVLELILVNAKFVMVDGLELRVVTAGLTLAIAVIELVRRYRQGEKRPVKPETPAEPVKPDTPPTPPAPVDPKPSGPVIGR